MIILFKYQIIINNYKFNMYNKKWIKDLIINYNMKINYQN